ncbi:MAG: hypothetical protein DPW09_14505 [Anaerolineae bacterium]|nr:hypothetical protein [Anaerolineae bacterium]
MLEAFNRFAPNYFNFFTQGESEADRAKELNSALNRLQQQWELISRVCAQREIREFQEALELADGKAKVLYDYYKGYKATTLSPVTYFEKIFGITRSPFTPYPALISIPFQVFDNPNEWQALAHELGHYIYWNSAELKDYRQVQARLKDVVLKALNLPVENYEAFQKKSKLINIWTNWLEETFADICGALLVGPLHVVSALRIADETAFAPAQLIRDDGEHPAPYLRPLIGLKTLVWVAEQAHNYSQSMQDLKDIIKLLEGHWTILQQKAGAESSEISGVKLSELEASVGEVVQAILGNESGPWIKDVVNGQREFAGLGSLINFEKAWLDDLSHKRAEIEAALKYETEVRTVQVQEPLPDATEFEALVVHLKNDIDPEMLSEEANKKLRKALLELNLEGRGAYCRSEYVRDARYGDFGPFLVYADYYCR